MQALISDPQQRLRNRRAFLLDSLRATLGSAICYSAVETILSTRAAAQNSTPKELLEQGPANASWKTVLVPEGEPGEPMVIRGTSYGRDGRTPLQGARLYVYHTDARGHYTPGDRPGAPRLRGWMKTGADGRYEFRSIKPAPYPGREIAAHIHPTLDAPGYPARWTEEYWFTGDRFLAADVVERNAALGSFSAVVRLERDSGGLLVGARDFRLT